MTTVGVNRARHAREVEMHPSRFTGTNVYTLWAARADVYAAIHYTATPTPTPNH